MTTQTKRPVSYTGSLYEQSSVKVQRTTTHSQSSLFQGFPAESPRWKRHQPHPNSTVLYPGWRGFRPDPRYKLRPRIAILVSDWLRLQGALQAKLVAKHYRHFTITIPLPLLYLYLYLTLIYLYLTLLLLLSHLKNLAGNSYIWIGKNPIFWREI